MIWNWKFCRGVASAPTGVQGRSPRIDRSLDGELHIFRRGTERRFRPIGHLLLTIWYSVRVQVGELPRSPRNPRRFVVNGPVRNSCTVVIGLTHCQQRDTAIRPIVARLSGSRPRERGTDPNPEGFDRAPVKMQWNSLTLCLTDRLWLTGYFGSQRRILYP